MKTSANGRQLIEQFEGCILQAYDDINDKIVRPGQNVRGTLTIGYGHTSAAGLPRVNVGDKITKEQADQILASDLGAVEREVNSLVKVKLTQNQFDALVSFQFNTGGLGRASLLRRLNAGDYQGAADGFMAWSKANGNPNLLRPRREKERALFLTPGPKVDNKPAAGAAGAVVVAGGTAVATNSHLAHHPHFWPIAIAIVLIATAVGLGIYFYRKS